jgi:hypothetical protein
MPQPTRIRRSSALTETTAPSTYLLSKGGKALPFVRVVLAGAARRDSMGGGRREGKIVSAQLQGTGWLLHCARHGGAAAVERYHVRWVHE